VAMLVVEESRALPHVVFLRFVGKPSDDEVKVYLDNERDRYKRDRPMPSVAVLELLEVWTSSQRKMVKDFQDDTVDVRREMELGLAMVVPNAIIRGAFTAYHWLAPPSYPTAMVPRAVDAHDSISKWLKDAGRPVPDRASFVREALQTWPGKQAVPGRGMVPVSVRELMAQVR
jgi:hypothetical protein